MNGPTGDEAARICSELIRIDTTNPGDGSGPGERKAAEHVAALLDEAGVGATLLERTPGRTNVVARIAGADPARPALLVHGHLDVVPAEPADWSVHPFSGEVREGDVWGRGAVDMKGTCAMTLAVVRSWARAGVRPPRDIVLAFTADEEATGEDGAYHLAGVHRELFDGCTEGISESGGFSVTARRADGEAVRLYPVATGERGVAWLDLTARGTAGHGSRRSADNAVAELSHALSRLAAHPWPVRLTPAVRALLDGLADALGTSIDHDRLDAEAARLGQAGQLFAHTLRDSANPTVLSAGYKVNVIPGEAHAQVDGRFLPGRAEGFLETVDRLLGPKVSRAFVNFEDATDADPGGATFAALGAALMAEDPLARPVPYVMSGGTDAKAFAGLGIRTYGFAPLLLPEGLDYWGLFHGVDERVPVAGLDFGVRVLDRFLREVA